MASRLVRVETLLPANDVRSIDAIVASGEYATRTEVVRVALKRLLYSEERLQRMEAAFTLVEKRLRKLGLKPEQMLSEFGRRQSSGKAEELIAHAKAVDAGR